MTTLWTLPPASPTLTTNELHIYRASLTVGADALPKLAGLLSPDEQSRATRFVFPQDRNRFVAARGYLRQILSTYLELPAHELRFVYEQYGKPALAMPADGYSLSFNLAHSGDLALYAITHRRRVGIDVERIRYDLAYKALLKDIFTPREQLTIAELPDLTGRLVFFHGWVRKEAYLKARGDGLAYAPNNFEVSLLPGEPVVLTFSAPTEEPCWSLYPLDPGPGYVAAIVVEGENMLLRFFTQGDD